MGLVTDIRDWFKKDEDEELDDFEEPNSYYTSPLIRLSGQPGTGKTYDMFRLVLYSGYHYRLPVGLQDTKGDLSVYLYSLKETLRAKKDIASKKKLDFLDNKVVIWSEGDGRTMIKVVEKIQRQMSSKKNRYPTMILGVDEAGTLRWIGGEEFWIIASTFRNAGITCFATSHRETGIGGVPPLAREATRAVILYRQYEDPEFFGVKVDNAELPKPLGNTRAYIDSVDRKVKTFELPNGGKPLKIENIPEVLIHPVNSTRVEEMMF